MVVNGPERTFIGLDYAALQLHRTRLSLHVRNLAVIEITFCRTLQTLSFSEELYYAELPKRRPVCIWLGLRRPCSSYGDGCLRRPSRGGLSVVPKISSDFEPNYMDSIDDE